MSQYFDESPRVASAEAEVAIDVGGSVLTLRTDRGVFSHGRVDPGTAVLLRNAPPPPLEGTLLDLGSGSGVLALALARLAPRATVWAVDVNERARQLTAANAAVNDLANVAVAEPEGVPADVRFDLIWSNPPIRIGKSALHALLSTWLGRLSTEGRAVLVVQKHLGADSLQRWLIDEGWPTTRLASSRGYRVLQVRSLTLR
jgi:16S rRNA (guanine1207-N2)-methyltransferase